MVDLYVADIRCSSEDTRLEHEDTIAGDVTLKDALKILKEESIDKYGMHACICLENPKIILKYKFSDEIVCPKELINTKVEWIDHIFDDGGAVYYIKLKEAA